MFGDVNLCKTLCHKLWMCKIFVACVSGTNGAIVMDLAAGEGYHLTPSAACRPDTLLRRLLWYIVNGLYVDRIVLFSHLLERLYNTVIRSCRLACLASGKTCWRVTPKGWAEGSTCKMSAIDDQDEIGSAVLIHSRRVLHVLRCRRELVVRIPDCYEGAKTAARPY